ncbi:MAG: hypothetical protein E7588_03460 [Ruminococcaceae bacterium]|nr:hypothetical protein [Oscillospiraceae bacterium]
MKKILTFALILVIGIFALTACANPVEDEFTDFINVKMVQANANYDALTAEMGNWESYEADEQFITSLKEIIIPKCEENISIVSAISLETDEVKAVREQFIGVMHSYKDAFNDILAGFENADEAALNQGNEKLNAGLALLDEYNASLDSLAASIGMKVEY